MPDCDLLITNAHVFTADPQQPSAEAIGVVGNRIVFVGSQSDAEPLRGKTKRVIDAQGATLMPGFIDSHYHLLWGSLELGDAHLENISSMDDIASRINEHRNVTPEREWVVAQGFNYASLPFSLTRHHLDQIVTDQPFIVVSYDAHTVWANTEALRRGGILNGLATPEGSFIVMEQNGTAGGELREAGAYGSIMKLIPPPNDNQKRTLLLKGLSQAAAAGITSVHNMNGDLNEIALYAALEDTNELSLRVYVPFHVKPEMGPESLNEALQMRTEFQTDMVRSSAVKFFMDGVIESYTALLVDDYADLPGNKGMANFTADHFNVMATAADKFGLQIFVHAIGDGAVRRTLDGFETAQHLNGPRDSRHRIEHIELVHLDDLPRFAQLGVIASVQPLHSPLSVGEQDVWPVRVGQSRWDRSFAWQKLREAGARLVFGSDWSVVTQDPIHGVYAALNRQTWLPNLPDQRQTLENTLVGYTRDAAYAEFQELEKGQIKIGLLADLVLLSEDIFTVAPDEIMRVRSVLTIVGGRIVYESI
jgi:predicted amidohydrolase YtcJ